MTGSPADMKVYGDALAAAAYLAFAVHLARLGYARGDGGQARWTFVAAVAGTAAWAAAALVEPLSRSVTPGFVAAAFDTVRYGFWFAFLLRLLQPHRQLPTSWRQTRPLAAAAGAALAVAAVILLVRALSGRDVDDASRVVLAAALSLPLLGMVLVEQLFRNLAEDSRWNAKPLCLGLALVFAFDLYVNSEALLFGRFDPDAVSIRGAVHSLAVPLLFMASRRRADWIRRLQVSRSAAFHSATLLFAGGYLLFMSAVGYYVRYFGGNWGRALQLGLLAAALAGLSAILLSGSLRSRLRVFVGKHFFSYRYDYRQEWLRFTAMLSTKSAPQEVGGLVIRGLAAMVECPAGALWTRSAGDADYRPTARWNLPASEQREPGDSPFCVFLQQQAWVIDVDEYRSAPRRYGALVLPDWLTENRNLWLVVPLLVGDGLAGFVTLARPRAAVELNWEVRDLLKTASRQAAGFLAQMQATEALLEARKFDAFNKMSAFVVHDLKNIVTQLSLMMKNAQRLHANPEFQQDMLLTVDSSLEKMRRLMLQLREGATPAGGARGVELAPMVGRLKALARSTGRDIQIECAEGLSTRGHDERFERVLGHLVQNALDATPADGRVWVKASRFSGQIKVEVGDTGAGMSEDFVQNKLFRPFSTTKHGGMGVGSYESLQYIRELGGSIQVRSSPGAGTVMTVHVPLLDVRAVSDLQMPASST